MGNSVMTVGKCGNDGVTSVEKCGNGRVMAMGKFSNGDGKSAVMTE